MGKTSSLAMGVCRAGAARRMLISSPPSRAARDGRRQAFQRAYSFAAPFIIDGIYQMPRRGHRDIFAVLMVAIYILHEQANATYREIRARCFFDYQFAACHRLKSATPCRAKYAAAANRRRLVRLPLQLDAPRRSTLITSSVRCCTLRCARALSLISRRASLMMANAGRGAACRRSGFATGA